MDIICDNIEARIENPTPDVDKLLREHLRYHPDGFEHVYNYKANRWDGFNYLYNTATHTFRVGLLPRVLTLLEKGCASVRIKYIGTKPPEILHSLQTQTIKPFEFQQKVAQVVRNHSSGIIVSPTGTGKTVMIALMINELRRRTMVLVTDVVLLDQMQQNLQRYFDDPIGIIGDGEFDLQQITVSTVQSLLSISRAKSIGAADRRKLLVAFLEHTGAVISDEAHLYDSDGVAEIMPLFKDADRFYGCSATPYGWAEKVEKRQNLELEQHFGEVIYDCRKINFIELGLKVPILVDIRDRTPIHREYTSHKKRGFRGEWIPDWTKNYKDCLDTEILNSEQYHTDVAKYAWKLASEGRSAFVHASHSIKFGEQIQKMVPGAVLVNGSTPRLERRDIYKAVQNKDILTMVSDVGGTGLDIPSLDAIVLASDLKDIRQLKGRVERASPGKQSGLLVDFHTDCMFLSKHHAIRRSQYEHDGNMIIR